MSISCPFEVSFQEYIYQKQQEKPPTDRWNGHYKKFMFTFTDFNLEILQSSFKFKLKLLNDILKIKNYCV